LTPSTGALSGITSFGEDAWGELYVVTQGSGGPDGAVYKIVPPRPAGAGDGAGKPAALFLGRPQPNPAARGVSLQLDLPAETRVRAGLYDTRGRLVRLLHDGTWAAGGHALAWDGRDQRGAMAPTGIDLVRVEAAGDSRSAKVAWVR
jgi:YD repeat-containing protein